MEWYQWFLAIMWCIFTASGTALFLIVHVTIIHKDKTHNIPWWVPATVGVIVGGVVGIASLFMFGSDWYNTVIN